MKKLRWYLLAFAAALGLAAVTSACTQAAGLEGSYALANPPCTSAADCSSGLCAGSPGWCTELCSADVGCPEGSCVQSKAALDICFPTCASDADCAAYGLPCQAATTVDGVAASVCAAAPTPPL